MELPRLYRIEEAAAVTHLSAGTVRDRIARGEIRAVRVGRVGVRIPADEFDRLVRDSEAPVAAPKAQLAAGRTSAG